MRKQYILSAIIILLAAIGLYGLLPQLGSFATTVDAIRQARLSYVGFAAVVATVGYLCATSVYVLLAYKTIKFSETLLVQIAGLFINRIMPAGIGGLGLNFLYLRAHKHNALQATTVVTLNGLIGLIAHMTLLTFVVATHPSLLGDVLSHVASQQARMLLLVAAVLSLIAMLILRRWQSKRVAAFRASLARQATLLRRYYARQPWKLVKALLLAAGITLSSVVSLWLCSQAVGIDVSLYVVFVVYTFGVIFGTAVPVPGGLGATEAALVAGLVAQQTSAATALAAVLLFRLVTFWLGLVLGAAATAVMQSKRLLQAS